MRVIVTGATGNVGASVIQALRDPPKVDEAAGLARRRPTWDPVKTMWGEEILAEEHAAEKIAQSWDRPAVPLGVAS